MEWYSLVKARIIGANVQHTNDRSPYWIWPCVISFAFMQTWRKPEKRELFGLSQWISLQLGIVPFFLLKIQKDSFLECGSLRPCIGPDAALKETRTSPGQLQVFDRCSRQELCLYVPWRAIQEPPRRNFWQAKSRKANEALLNWPRWRFLPMFAEIHKQVKPKATSFLPKTNAKREHHWPHLVRKQASGS